MNKCKQMTPLDIQADLNQDDAALPGYDAKPSPFLSGLISGIYGSLFAPVMLSLGGAKGRNWKSRRAALVGLLRRDYSVR
jgi:hypothetical protein